LQARTFSLEYLNEKKPSVMKKLFFTTVACLTLFTTVRAPAQVYLDDSGNTAGTNRLDDPNYGWPQSHWRRGYDSYARGDCRIIRERIVMPDGQVIYRSREICG
jgi:hypothetical protein